MIEITLTATEFNEFVFDDVTQQTVERQYLHSAHRLVQELSDVSMTEEKPLTDAERKQEKLVGRKLWPGRRLKGDEATFTFDDIELELLIVLLHRAAPRHPLLTLPDFFALLERLTESLQAYQAKAEPDADEAAGE
ncbi:MAG: hypothetical protein OXH66_14380 [Gemmatimonadetes bacterium]|nr:hypothetical protein [Gemmatimonadota bacterium]